MLFHYICAKNHLEPFGKSGSLPALFSRLLKYSISPLFDIRCCRNNPMFDKLYELYDEFVDAQYH